MIRRRCRMSLLAFVFAALLMLNGCSRARQDTLADPLMDVFRNLAQEEGLTRQQTLGKQLFLHYCATCHGDRGEGDGQNAYNLDPMPPDFKETLKSHPPSYWRQIVEGGTAAVGLSPLCPPWGHELTAKQIDAIVSYMQTLSEPPAESSPTNTDTSQTD